jgi:hypothetical protein
MTTKLLEEAVARLSVLPKDDQDRTAEVMMAFGRERTDYTRQRF